MNAITVNEMRELTMDEAETIGGGFWKELWSGVKKVAKVVAPVVVPIIIKEVF